MASYRADASKAKLNLIITGGASKKGCMANIVLKKYTYSRDNKNLGLGGDAAEEEEVDEQIRIPVILKADSC